MSLEGHDKSRIKMPAVRVIFDMQMSYDLTVSHHLVAAVGSLGAVGSFGGVGSVAAVGRIAISPGNNHANSLVFKQLWIFSDSSQRDCSGWFDNHSKVRLHMLGSGQDGMFVDQQNIVDKCVNDGES